VVQLDGFLTSALVGGEWSTSRPGRLTHGERNIGTHSMGGWLVSRASLDAVTNRKNPILKIYFHIIMSLTSVGRNTYATYT
jgi:hypothetical protein